MKRPPGIPAAQIFDHRQASCGVMTLAAHRAADMDARISPEGVVSAPNIHADSYVDGVVVFLIVRGRVGLAKPIHPRIIAGDRRRPTSSSGSIHIDHRS